jgi:hypothetical protein
MHRAAVVAGTVRDAEGRPAHNVLITLLTNRSQRSATLTLSNNSMRTDERGDFRIYGLEPGRYYLAAFPMTTATDAAREQSKDLVDRTMDELSKGIDDTLPARLSQLSQTVPAREVDLAPVFFPGTHRLDLAVPIDLKPGDDLGSMDLTIVSVPTGIVSGRVLLPDGLPASGTQVRLSQIASGDALRDVPPRRYSATTDATGGFSIRRLAPGPYQLLARLAGATTGEQLWARDQVEVLPGGHSQHQMSLERGVEVSGRVTLVAAAGSGEANSLEKISVAVVAHDQPRPSAAEDLSLRPGGARVALDGQFVVRGLQPAGLAGVAVAGLPRGWWVETAMINGLDLLESPRSIGGDRGASGDLQITLTNEVTEVTGVVQTSDAILASTLAIVLAPEDWKERPADSQRIRMVRVSEDGTFAIGQVVPGQYILGAVVGMEVSEVRNPEVLSQLVNASVRFEIKRGEHVRRTLRIPGSIHD